MFLVLCTLQDRKSIVRHNHEICLNRVRLHEILLYAEKFGRNLLVTPAFSALFL